MTSVYIEYTNDSTRIHIIGHSNLPEVCAAASMLLYTAVRYAAERGIKYSLWTDEAAGEAELEMHENAGEWMSVIECGYNLLQRRYSDILRVSVGRE